MISYLDRSVNPRDVWRDDTALCRGCPERITDLNRVGNVQKISKWAGNGRSRWSGRARLFQEWIGSGSSPAASLVRQRIVIALQGMDGFAAREEACTGHSCRAHKDETWQALVGEQHGRGNPDRRMDDCRGRG